MDALAALLPQGLDPLAAGLPVSASAALTAAIGGSQSRC